MFDYCSNLGECILHVRNVKLFTRRFSIQVTKGKKDCLAWSDIMVLSPGVIFLVD